MLGAPHVPRRPSASRRFFTLRPARSPRGSVLLEATYAMMFLAGLSLVFMKLALNITAPRQWTLQQTVTDAYLTYEKSLAQRAPFSEVISDDSLWPISPESAETEVSLGSLPGGIELTGTVFRTRTADTNNYPIDGGTGTTTTNPAGVRTWHLQSLLSYQIGDRTYVKTRTVVRSQ